MRLTRQQALRAAVWSVVAGAALVAGGCGRGADENAVGLMEVADWQAATHVREASPALLAIANGRAANEQFAASLPIYHDLTYSTMLTASAAWNLSRMSSSARLVAASSGELAGYEPSAALAGIDEMVEKFQGREQAAWSPSGSDVELPTLSALNNRSNKLKDQISETERTLADLRKKQQELVQTSVQDLEQSKNEQGERSVQLFTQSANARKAATDLGIEISEVEISLTPLKQEVAIVDEQIRILSDAANILVSHRENIERSWRGVTAEAESRATRARAIFAGAADSADSVAAQATRLAELSSQQRALAQNYERHLAQGITFARASVSNSERAIREARPLKVAVKRSSDPNELLKQALDPSTARFTHGRLELAMATHRAGQVALLSNEADAIAAAKEAAQQMGQSLPDGLNAEALSTEANSIAQAARENLKSAEPIFNNAAEAVAPAATKRAAKVGQMATLHATALLAWASKDPRGADSALNQAKVLRENLLSEGGTLPALPGSLQRPVTVSGPRRGVER